MVMAVYERHVGEVRHHLADDLPLVSAINVEATQVLTDEVHHVAAFSRVTMEVLLPLLFLRMRDDDGIELLSPAVGQNEFDVPSHARLSVEFVAKREGNIVDAHSRLHLLKRYVRHRLVV